MLTLGDEKTLEFVAMATRDDLNANAEFIRLADTYIEVPSGSNKNNYANVDLIVSIAVAQKVDGKFVRVHAQARNFHPALRAA